MGSVHLHHVSWVARSDSGSESGKLKGIVVEVADVVTLYSRHLRACMLTAGSHDTCQDEGKGNSKGERRSPVKSAYRLVMEDV